MSRINKKSGAASLFLVIFASLLFMTIALSYTTIMLRDQRQAIAVNLSQSAYDAAMSGIEDAKVLLSKYYKCQNNPTAPECIKPIQAIENGNTCDAIARGLGYEGSDYKETFIGTKIGSSTAGDAANNIDQAYTCNKITLNTTELKANLKADESQVVPLFSKSKFNKVTLKWHQAKNQGGAVPGTWPNVDDNLLSKVTGSNKLPLLRLQYISDNENRGSFLIPNNLAGVVTNIKEKRTGAHCSSSLGNKVYYCTATFTVDEADRALLVLKSPYRATSYEVTLASGDNVIEFDGIQPEVDVTARANDRFRRVKARLQLGADFKYPEAAMAIRNGICKDFVVTDNHNDFYGNYKCD